MSNTRDCDSTRAAIGSARPDGFSLSRYSIFVAFRRVSVIVLIYLACRAATCRWKKTSPSREYGRGPSGRGRGGVGRGAGGGGGGGGGFARARAADEELAHRSPSALWPSVSILLRGGKTPRVSQIMRRIRLHRNAVINTSVYMCVTFLHRPTRCERRMRLLNKYESDKHAAISAVHLQITLITSTLPPPISLPPYAPSASSPFARVFAASG